MVLGLVELVLLGQVRSACSERVYLHGGCFTLLFYLFETGSHCKIKLPNIFSSITVNSSQDTD